MRVRSALAALAVACLAPAATAGEGRLNEIQVIGSHNSYHIAPAPPVMALLSATQPKAARSLAYTHRPLAEQFAAQGIRQIELDVFADPEGGRFAEPKAWRTLQALGRDPGPDPDTDG